MQNLEIYIWLLGAAVGIISFAGTTVWQMLRAEAKDQQEQIRLKADASRMQSIEASLEKKIEKLEDDNRKLIDKIEDRHQKELASMEERLSTKMDDLKSSITTQMNMLMALLQKKGD